MLAEAKLLEAAALLGTTRLPIGEKAKAPDSVRALIVEGTNGLKQAEQAQASMLKAAATPNSVRVLGHGTRVKSRNQAAKILSRVRKGVLTIYPLKPLTSRHPEAIRGSSE